MRRQILALSLLLLAAAPAAAQTPDAAPAPSVEQTEANQAEVPTYQEPSGTSGLPARAAPPRTLRAYWHLFGAFAITWILLFGYALSVGSRMARLDEEVRRLR